MATFKYAWELAQYRVKMKRFLRLKGYGDLKGFNKFSTEDLETLYYAENPDG